MQIPRTKRFWDLQVEIFDRPKDDLSVDDLQLWGRRKAKFYIQNIKYDKRQIQEEAGPALELHEWRSIYPQGTIGPLTDGLTP